MLRGYLRKMKKRENREFSSFRDPAGYIYYEDNLVYRKINKCYFKQYDYLMNSGLYDELVSSGLLISHKEVKRNKDYIVICVEKIPFISYPYEWCFEELKDAGMLTLKIQEICLKYDMVLKDASGYNIQFYKGKPIFIDTLSFDFYVDGSAWGAYGQFCRHFMAPLLLMRYVDENLNCLLKNYIDGIPLDVASNVLKGRGGLVSLEHIRLHSRSINKNSSGNNIKSVYMSKNSVVNMVLMMERQISKLRRKYCNSEWDKYYDNTNYDEIADRCKVNCVRDYVKYINISNSDVIWDLGSNDGKYSRVVSDIGGYVISFDIDVNAVNRSYNLVRENNEKNILPLLLDLTNPSPSIGVDLCERKSFNDRAPVKCVIALALIHHISISNNVPFDKVASWFSKLGEYLIIEFVPKDDSQVEKLLKTRNDIFDDYDINNFEECFGKYYKIVKKRDVKNSKRVIYLMKVV